MKKFAIFIWDIIILIPLMFQELWIGIIFSSLILLLVLAIATFSFACAGCSIGVITCSSLGVIVGVLCLIQCSVDRILQ